MATLGTIVDNIRRNLGEITANYYQDTDLKSFAGEAYKYYSMIMIEEGDGYYETTTNLALTANTATIDLSTLDPYFYHISVLERNTLNGTIPLIPSERRYKSNTSINTGVGDAYLPTYKLRSLNLVLEPTPTVSEAASSTTGLKLDYVYIPTFPTSASADAFEFDSSFPTLYEPMIEIYATIAALEAKDAMGGVSDIESFRGRLAVWEEKFLNSLERKETPERVEYVGVDYSNTDSWR